MSSVPQQPRECLATDAPAPWPGVARALIVAAHPDDAEYACGGLIQRLHSWGVDVAYLIVSDGDRGRSPETSPGESGAERQSEQVMAARELGVTDVRFFSLPDGELRYERCLEGKIVAVIRDVRPQLLVTHDPLTRLYRQHPDHRAVGETALAAAFPAARMATYYMEQLQKGLGAWTVEHALLFATDAPDWFIELSESHLDVKIRALQRHESQAESFGGGIDQRVRLRAEQAATITPFRCAEAYKYALLR